MRIILVFLLIIFLYSCGNDEVEKHKNILKVNGDSVKTKIVLLGTGTPNPSPERLGPALAIIVNGQAYLVDAGIGIVRQANAAYKKGIKELRVEKLNIVFLTHLHSDHTLGLADLILTPWILNRETKLKIYGPPGSKAMINNIYDAYSDDIRARLSGLQPINNIGYKSEVVEYKSGLIYQDKNVDVYAYKVDHGDMDYAYAFQFITPDKVITVSGDCRPCEGIYEASLGCDILIHEVYSYVGFLTRKPEWQRYHSKSHTSTRELAELAKKVKPKLLILYHILDWGASEEILINEIKMDYDGKIICGKDLLVIE